MVPRLACWRTLLCLAGLVSLALVFVGVASAQDAGVRDAGLADAGVADAATVDAPDGGVADAGADAGVDAGEPDAEIPVEPEVFGMPEVVPEAPGVDHVPFVRVAGVSKLGRGLGAVIVPALTSGDTEPGWIMRSHDGLFKESAAAGTGIAAPPGHYEVLAGSGARAQKTKIAIEVRAGQLTRIKPSWGALVVHTIDTDETPFRGPYLLFDLMTRESYGFGRGAQEEVGERVDAWLLRPSIYKLVGPLEDLDTVTNFASVVVRPGEVQHIVVVMDQTTGDFHGGGAAPNTDFTVRGSLLGHRPKKPGAAGGFKVKARVGGDISQSSSDNTLGVGGSSLGFGLFTDFSANYRWKKHLFNLVLDFKGGVRKNSGESFVRKVQDEIRVDTIYIHQTWPHVGFYARLSAKSQVAITNLRYEEPQEIIIDGEEPVLLRKLKVAGTLDPMFLTESTGLNLRVLRHIAADLDLRLGASLRQTVTGGFLVSADDPDTDAVELERASWSTFAGGEVVIALTTRLTQIASLHIDVDLFLAREVQVLGEATLSVRLWGPVSVGILGALRRDDLTNERIGLSEAIFVRASKQVF